MSLLTILSRLKHSKHIKWIRPMLNMLYYDPDAVVLHLKNFDTVTVDGCHFNSSSQIDSLQKVNGNAWFTGIRPDDIVVDIGANIGAIAIPLAKQAKKVFAIEPLFYKELQDNIELNKLSNVTVLSLAIGKEDSKIIEFAGRKATCDMITFVELRKQIGGRIDFLKIDCEGGEWDIKPSHLRGIRQLRVEFHIRRLYRKQDKDSMNKWLDWLKAQGYKTDLEILPVRVNPYYSEMSLLRAWL